LLGASFARLKVGCLPSASRSIQLMFCRCPRTGEIFHLEQSL
jgi:hypothetical protein